VRLALAPGEKTMISPLPLSVPEGIPALFTVDAAVIYRADTAWAKAGDVLARGQGVFDQSRPERHPAGGVRLVPGNYNIGIAGDGFSYLFDRMTGRLTSIRMHGHEVLKGAELSFWRAQTNNDYGAVQPFYLADWALAGHYAVPKSLTAAADDQGVTVNALYLTAGSAHDPVAAVYHFSGDGVCTLTLTWLGEEKEAPEFGMMFRLDDGYQQVSCLGRGPEENMPDRTCGAFVGKYSYDLTKETGYVYPQEYGLRTDVREAVLSGHDLPSLRFAAAGMPFLFSAATHTPLELENAMHRYELPPRTQTVVRVLGGERGAGGDDSWGALPLPEYRFRLEKGMKFTFTFGPVKI